MFTPVYIENFLSPPVADEVYQTLMTDLDWVHRENVPRKEYWATLNNRSYTYGRGVGVRTYDSQPSHVYIEAVRDMLVSMNEKHSWSGRYEGCFLNRYDHGRDQLGWHADDDPGIDHDNPIAVVTLGNARMLQWKLIKDADGNPVKGMDAINGILLKPGSVLFMPPGMQDEYYHRIPKAVSPEPDGPRISMTYRSLK